MSTKSPTLLEEKALADGLDDVGCAVIRGLLFASECDDYRSRYATREHFRSHIIDRLEGRYLAAVGGFTTGSAVIAIIFTVGAQSQPGVYFAFALLGFGWGGLIPIQEVIWARFFGRRHLGAVRSAALPFALAISASAPLAVAWYHDRAGSYTGALAVVAALT